ncbi:hypothetical protein DM01DRAFT_1403580 [Hesseltinella vesiculosa]|uniref:PIPK domain-containing protein n=1 Tax=Hesseltinella vesiculosa TaxID=101127 RepID=A0A1X2GYP9_9FUNG|nr:hypothetical protein DM01DRAFT_1403580 [Hesseltinella vesiculosa]
MATVLARKPMPLLKSPVPIEQKPLPAITESWQLDDEAKVHLWKLTHNWLQDEHLQSRWATILYTVFMHILFHWMDDPSCIRLPSNSTVHRPISIQLFETGHASQSVYLPAVHHGEALYTLSDLPIKHVLGGTLRLYGVQPEFQIKLLDLVGSAIYTLYSLTVESKLLRDHQIPVLTHLPAYDIHPTWKQGSPWRRQLLGWITGKRDPPPAPLPGPSGAPLLLKQLKQRALGDKPPSTVNVTAPALVHPETALHPLFHQLRTRLEHASISSSPMCLFFAPSIVVLLDSEEERKKKDKRISAPPALASLPGPQHSSPDPTPTLRRKLTHLVRRSSSLLSLPPDIPNTISNYHRSESSASLRRMSAYNLLRASASTIIDTSKFGLDHLYLDTSSIDAFKHHQQITLHYTVHLIGCPDRPCLGPLLCSLKYFTFDDDERKSMDSFVDLPLQAVLVQWYEQRYQPCKTHIDQLNATCRLLTPPQKTPQLQHTDSSSSNSYSSASTQHSQSDTNKSTSPLASSPTSYCPDVHQQGCRQLFQDHVLCFSHGSQRIQASFTLMPVKDMVLPRHHNPSPLSSTTNLLCTWAQCVTCDARSPTTWVSWPTAQFSFGKYLELFFYSQRFASTPDVCQHTHGHDENSHSLTRCFGVLPSEEYELDEAMEIRFTLESIHVYALKGPPLQSVLSAQSSSTATSSTNCSARVSLATLTQWRQLEDQTLDGFFRQLRKHLTMLQEHGRLDKDNLQHWLATFDEKHTHLSRILAQQHTSLSLNDYRRQFAVATNELTNALSSWHQAQTWAAEQQEFLWMEGRPDYTIAKSGTHCFPGSAIIIRESEPTSIIAHTLNCMDYEDELAAEQGVGHDEDESLTPLKKDAMPPRPPAKSYATSTNTKSSHQDDKDLQVVDKYYSTIERKFIAPSLGTASETASFRTMVMETVRNNVSDMQQSRRLTRMRRKWHRMARFPEDVEPAKPDHHDTSLESILSDTTSEFQETFVQNAPQDTPMAISPHILHRFAHDNMEFTCTVYYAHDFEKVRRLCGVEQLMIESLSRCQSWSASGGKSKSQFYKTQGKSEAQHNNRMVVKEMVNAWNIAEKDAFLRFAPKYFQYIKETAQAPSILAKIFGFYSLQIRTLDDKRTLLDIDVLVMEQLFYGQTIERTFDFKGIPDRQLDEEKRQKHDATLWDGDWRQDYRMGYAVNGQSKAWMESAILRDTEFLATGNIMDYSLLVGVDPTSKELIIGIVDFIGAYTWYKKIESKSKSTIQRRREVTVLPPDLYRARFCKQVLDYFIPIPGKFDKIALESIQPSLWLK